MIVTLKNGEQVECYFVISHHDGKQYCLRLITANGVKDIPLIDIQLITFKKYSSRELQISAPLKNLPDSNA